MSKIRMFNNFSVNEELRAVLLEEDPSVLELTRIIEDSLFPNFRDNEIQIQKRINNDGDGEGSEWTTSVSYTIILIKNYGPSSMGQPYNQTKIDISNALDNDIAYLKARISLSECVKSLFYRLEKMEYSLSSISISMHSAYTISVIVKNSKLK